jgi:hypothetical protein
MFDRRRSRRVRGRVVAISEGGFAVIADLDLQPGDPIRLLIEPESGAQVRVSGIVWYDVAASPSGRRSRLRKFGCIVSQPTRPFSALFGALTPGYAAPRPVPNPLARPRAVDRALDPGGIDADLPRSGAFQPPPEVELQESLRYFRVQLKQIGSPRTRLLTLRAQSATQAERIALDELDQIDIGSGGWSILQIAPIASG